MTAVLRPEIDAPHIVEAELGTIIRDYRSARDGKLDTGVSEVGHPCSRYLVHSLLGHAKPQGGDRWASMCGTFIHAGLEGIFTAHNAATTGEDRYLIERKVCVGQAGGIDIVGTMDLFDIDSGTVVDWKAVSPSQLLKYKANGPSKQYRIQAHLYGRGLAREGYSVRQVMIAFLPRAGELGTPYFRPGTTEWANRGARFFWSEPYDENIAVQALSRLDGLHELIQAMGPDALLAAIPPCTEWFCPWCSTRSLRTAAPTPRPTTVAEMFGINERQ